MQLGSAFKKKSGSDAESDVAADINVTPLVDVCLVMLIIFMVVTPLLRAGADVNLPQTNMPPKMPEGSAAGMPPRGVRAVAAFFAMASIRPRFCGSTRLGARQGGGCGGRQRWRCRRR